MKFAILILTLFAFILFAGSYPTDGKIPIGIFQGPAFLLISLLMMGSIFWICTKMLFNWKKIPFLICHLGVSTLLIGAFIGFLFEVRSEQFRLQVSPGGSWSIPINERDNLDLPFGFGVSAFKATYYDQTYSLIKQIPPQKEQPPTYKFIAKLSFENNQLSHPSFGTLSKEKLCADSPNFMPTQYLLTDDLFLQKDRLMESDYQATMTIFPDTNTIEPLEFPWGVNRPLSYGGWKFYLMDYDQEQQRFVSMVARKDPGLPFVKAGIYMIIFGTACLCFRQCRRPISTVTEV